MAEMPPIADPGAPDEPAGPKEQVPLWVALLLVWSCASSLIGTALTDFGPESEPYKWWLVIPLTGLWACLCVACCNGVNWARWVIVAVCLFAILISFDTSLDDIPQTPVAKIWEIVDDVNALIIAGVLLLPQMKRYFVGAPKPTLTEP